MPEAFSTDSAEPLSEAKLRSFIARHLPAWQQACDADDRRLHRLHKASFGTSALNFFFLRVGSNTPQRG